MASDGRTKVLIVDDSPLIRTILTRVLADDPTIRVVAGAKDAIEAREAIIAHRPDVIILDIELPHMNGLVFLVRLMEHYPVPVIICSGVTGTNRELAVKAIELGATDVVCKPNSGGSDAMRRLGAELAEKVRAAKMSHPTPPPIPPSAVTRVSSFRAAGLDPDNYLIAIGASTGGTEAIRQVLAHFPGDSPPITMVQHMPEEFTRSFADRLNQLSPIKVTEATDGDVLQTGCAYLARGGIQMRVRNTGKIWRIAYGTSEPVNRHCPSVDVLFDAVAGCRTRQVIGILLTGMGADGAQGLLNMHNNGAITIAQDKLSSVVYGMPKVAMELNAVDYQCAPSEVARVMMRALQQRTSARSVRRESECAQ